MKNSTLKKWDTWRNKGLGEIFGFSSCSSHQNLWGCKARPVSCCLQAMPVMQAKDGTEKNKHICKSQVQEK